MTNMINRIEKLEQQVYKINSDPIYHEQRIKPIIVNLATLNQKSYIVKLGGVAPINMTKKEAGIEIDRLLFKREVDEATYDPYKLPEVTEPKEVDSDETGVDDDGVML